MLLAIGTLLERVRKGENFDCKVTWNFRAERESGEDSVSILKKNEMVSVSGRDYTVRNDVQTNETSFTVTNPDGVQPSLFFVNAFRQMTRLEAIQPDERAMRAIFTRLEKNPRTTFVVPCDGKNIKATVVEYEELEIPADTSPEEEKAEGKKE